MLSVATMQSTFAGVENDKGRGSGRGRDPEAKSFVKGVFNVSLNIFTSRFDILDDK